MIKLLILLAFLYLAIGVGVEFVARKRKNQQIKFDATTIERVVKWPWIVFKK